MKARLPHKFILFSMQYTLESMIINVAKVAFDVFNNQGSDFGAIACHKKYTVKTKKYTVTGKVLLTQTWLIDLMYDLICLEKTGTNTITKNETLYLIDLYNDYCNKKDISRYNKKDAFLNLYGFLGEQIRFQDIVPLYQEFSREKYILRVVSSKDSPKNTYKIDVEKDIFDTTGFSINDYSYLLFIFYWYFSKRTPCNLISSIHIDPSERFTNKDFLNIIEKYSISIDEIRKNPLGRQVFYSKPILKIGGGYVSVNPFLVLSTFVNALYWVMRNKYQKTDDHQRFINAFGVYFEMYFEELLQNCLSQTEYENIPTSNRKSADWHLKLNGRDFLIEQKSGLSAISIKQNQTDISKLKEHIKTTWGKAVEQLQQTQLDKNIQSPIKIILVYEQYYKSECLNELFKLRTDLFNDHKYWLLTIRELEMLLFTYKTDKALFEKIVNKKDFMETTISQEGRDLFQIMLRYGVKKTIISSNMGLIENLKC